ncbi:GFA family protein [Endozoicomonas sp. 4G]|uniref:GFA family protein n=1 Tax=Endozoicomonas sp. 4G TaxID=2872754 RepID=UPI0020787FE9|nr:GFA family protein [Endozoicomonas sp. 4G]
MSETTHGTGKFLCGSVKLSCEEMSLNVGACHCSTCQSWVGGPLLSVDCGSNVKIEGKEKISIYNSSEWAERAFCSNCGSHLFYRLKHNYQHIVPVGLFGKEYKFNFDHQIFIDEKPEYYCFSNQTKNMTGAELFAQSPS